MTASKAEAGRSVRRPWRASAGMASRERDWTKEMWTPRDRCFPAQERQRRQSSESEHQSGKEAPHSKHFPSRIARASTWA